ncbi:MULTISPECIES: EAL domain-containing protein [Ralstonia solanacearum species complex]|uniref:EAL domain-containing protein n=1 Tax=Ralstonia syzygii TaxID=28097 RepID=A0ABX7ZMQ8_9RALS|nr:MULTISPECIES: EAL domain-containing protein [Ralstonia solanacearum species complex]AMP39386.1 diguanylate cyclase [Ralstonia solanacearum]AXV78775.1 sensor domain-containing diguanylate cyclase [Ralstonia solanacearum]AXV88221.1 sensor domain-containing diguanylate cyclase [Ralstonia solanacearum]AXV92798.1 sensor domain-containing diguanylate cyclase [Ralstonia solanacearum]AXW07701.1 sensor domain-containing diguanylate cyclase [Ralstonia solanacearum]
MPKHAFFPTTLRGRLLALAAVAALPAVVVAIAGVALYRDRLTDHLEQRLSYETQSAATRVGMVLSNADQLLSVVVADESVLRLDRDECTRFVSRVIHNQSDFATLGVADARGKLVCTPVPGAIGLDIADRDFFRELIATGRPSLSNFLTGRTSHQPVMVATRAVVGPDGAILGVAYAAIRQSALMVAAGSTTAGPVYLVDSAGTVLSGAHATQPGDGPGIARSDLVSAAGPEPGATLFETDPDGTLRAYAAMAVPHATSGRLRLVRGIDATDMARQQRDVTLAGGGAIVLMLVLLLALIQTAMRRLVLPRVDALVDAARHYAAGDFSTRVAEQGGTRDELSLLERTFNEMRMAILRHDETVHHLTERFQRVARATNDWIFDWDIATGESWANASLHRLLGSDALLASGDEDGVSRTLTFQQFVHPEDMEAFGWGLRAALHSDRNAWHHVCRVIDASRAVRTVEIRASIYRGKDGRAMRMVGGVTDISQRSAMEAELRASEANLRVAEQIALLGSWRWDVLRDTATWSSGMYVLTGVPPGPPPSFAQQAQFFTGDSYNRLREAASRAVTEGEPYSLELEMIRRDGEHRWVLSRGNIERNEREEVVALFGTMQDITERRESDEQLRLLRRVVESVPSGITVADALQPDLPLVYVNPGFERMTGYRAEEVLGRNCRFLHSSEPGQPALNEVRAALRDASEIRVLLRNFRKDGHSFLNNFLLSPVRDSQGAVTHYVGIQDDVTEQEMTRARLAQHATADPLTGLPNRTLLADRVQQAVEMAARQRSRFYVALINIDRFKVVNDSLGHLLGDEVLRRVAERLRDAADTVDTVARFGGDVFALVISHAGSHGVDLGFDLFAEPIRVEGHEVFVTASIGVAEYPAHGSNSETLVRHAEMAMYYAKQNGRNRLEFFAPEMDIGVSYRLNLEHQIRAALEQGQFRLLYQPQIDSRTGRICGLEALIRWIHPTRGQLPPAAFIPVAEESGLVVEIGNWVLAEAAQQRAAWHARGLGEDLTIAVNVSPLQFKRGTVLPTLLRLQRQHGLGSGFLELEVTESMLMEGTERTIEDLTAIRQLGVRIAIDDFGTGYSSLAYLKRLPIDLIKIDRAFVKDIDRDSNDAAICTTVVVLAHNLGVKVCAEGVEDAAQSAFLASHQCDVLQGYYFSEPLLPDAVTALLERDARFTV